MLPKHPKCKSGQMSLSLLKKWIVPATIIINFSPFLTIFIGAVLSERIVASFRGHVTYHFYLLEGLYIILLRKRDTSFVTPKIIFQCTLELVKFVGMQVSLIKSSELALNNLQLHLHIYAPATGPANCTCIYNQSICCLSFVILISN